LWVDEGSRELSPEKNFLLVDSDTILDLSKCHYSSSSAEGFLSDFSSSGLPAGLSRDGDRLTVSKKGIFFLSFSSGSNSVNITLLAKDRTENEYVLLDDSYAGLPNGALPAGYTTDVGSASISNGRLVLDGIAAKPTRVLLPSYLSVFDNYVIETDMTITSVSEPTRWASFMFRYGTAGYFQMAIRQNAKAVNGVEFAKWVNSAWNVTHTASYSETIQSSKIYHLRIEVCGDTVKEYIDGTLMITSENANDFYGGRLGMQASGSVAAFSRVKVTLPADYAEIIPPHLTKIANVYTPTTGISLPPSIMTLVKTQTDLEAMSSVVRPQILVMNVNDMGDSIQMENGQTTPLLEALEIIDGRVIPAFRVVDVNQAETLAILLRRYGVVEAFLLSPNPSVISSARAKSPMLRGVLEIPYEDGNPVLSDVNRLAIRDSVNTCGAMAAMLPAQYSDQETIDYLQKRLITVYADLSGWEDSFAFNAILRGADGLIVNSLESVYAFMGLFPDHSILRHPLIIAHRGLGFGAPENSLEGAWLAYQAGADVIELDIYMTSDRRLVVIHDSTTTRTTNGSMTVEDSTLAQLQTLILEDPEGNFPNCRIPTLDDFFATFQGLDVQLFIEIKSSQPQIVPVLDSLIDQYHFSSQAVVIGKSASQLQLVRQQIPEISVGFLNSSIASITNMSSCVLSVLNMTTPLKSTYNPEFLQLTEAFLAQIHYRGVSSWPWTLDVLGNLRLYYRMDLGGVTTGIMGSLTTDPLFYHVNRQHITVGLGNAGTGFLLTGNLEKGNGQTTSCPPTYVLLNDGGTGITIDESLFVSGFTNPGKALILCYHTTQFADGKTYSLFDELVIIDVVDSGSE
jgi:glycerophosphoryl diester phosphodiesterase